MKTSYIIERRSIPIVIQKTESEKNKEKIKMYFFFISYKFISYV